MKKTKQVVANHELTLFFGPEMQWVAPFGSTSDWQDGMVFMVAWLPPPHIVIKRQKHLHRTLSGNKSPLRSDWETGRMTMASCVYADRARCANVSTFLIRPHKLMRRHVVSMKQLETLADRPEFLSPDATAKDSSPSKATRLFFPSAKLTMFLTSGVCIKDAVRSTPIPSMMLGLQCYPPHKTPHKSSHKAGGGASSQPRIGT